MKANEDLGYADLSGAFSIRKEPGQDAILQPPRPQIAPSAKVLQLLANQSEAEPEAAD